MKAKPRYEPPFGAIEQRELAWLVERGARHTHVAALLTLRVRAERDGWTRDGVLSLARWSGMKKRTFERAFRWLVEKGCAAAQELERRRGGTRGEAWLKRRKGVPYSEWPNTEEGVMATRSSAGRGRHVETKGAPMRAEDSVTVADNPETYPKICPKESDASRRSVAPLRSPSESRGNGDDDFLRGALLSELSKSIAPRNVETWLRDCALHVESEGAYSLELPNAFAAEWVREKYADKIRAALGRVAGRDVKALQFGIREQREAERPSAVDGDGR